MIHRNGGTAIDLSQVKAIHMEFLKLGGYPIFKIGNILYKFLFCEK
ncbi:hypothetical protein [Chryseobacterium muglaense]|uniref:Uncharacterized protein n=1 Tax=Chryseobacterium muglaense TaxID=2893752 RepID=A0ABR8MAD9_9FLAO|nr:hypothetical protein [Chryseobacterium muglaense]MBD3906881.1 hypothetical protein [Chryseobacterium muglaense]